MGQTLRRYFQLFSHLIDFRLVSWPPGGYHLSTDHPTADRGRAECPLGGILAQSWGRRPLLLIGFSALAVRALFFAVTSNPPLLICIQLLDGVSGSALGVLTALIVADLTSGTADSI